MKKLDTTPMLFNPEDAEERAEKLRDGDPDWEFRVEHDQEGQGLSRIAVYDEEGEFVGHI